LPDLIKPDDWMAPDHEDNVGITPKFLRKDYDASPSSEEPDYEQK